MKAVNLIPTDQPGRASAAAAGRSGGGAYVVLGLLAGLALLALLYGLASHQISNRRTQVASLTARAAQAQARANQLASYTSFVAMREQRVQAVTQLVDSRFDWANAFYELGRVLPSDASVTSLNGSIGSASGSTSGAAASSGSPAAASSAVTSATPPGSVPTITLAGCATSQPEVAFTLQRLRLIAGVGEVQLQSSTKTGAAGVGGSREGCGSGEAAFAVQVVFDPLPNVPASGASSPATAVSAPASGSTSPSSVSTGSVSTGSASTSTGGAVR
ncbi:MAG TPA: hypothetical protein VES65_00300 [Solirubrobacteraceae bacterium]|nr:hypothetical protein [Solirubrobacteraceae bacterium]